MAILTKQHTSADSLVGSSPNKDTKCKLPVEQQRSNDESNFKDLCRKRHTKARHHRPRVCFHDTVVVHYPEHAIPDPSSCWYTSTEMEEFRVQASREAREIMQDAERARKSRHEKLVEETYRLYENGLVDYDSHDNDGNKRDTISPAVVSCLAATCTAGHARSVRHTRLASRLRDLQDVPDIGKRERLMAQASLTLSQPAQLRATQLARWWAHHHQNRPPGSNFDAKRDRA